QLDRDVDLREVVGIAVVGDRGRGLDVRRALAFQRALAVEAEPEPGQQPVPLAPDEVPAAPRRGRAAQVEAQLAVLLDLALEHGHPEVLDPPGVAEGEDAAPRVLDARLRGDRGGRVRRYLEARPLPPQPAG